MIKQMIFLITSTNPVKVEDISDKLVILKDPISHWRAIFHTLDPKVACIVADIYCPFAQPKPGERHLLEMSIAAYLDEHRGNK